MSGFAKIAALIAASNVKGILTGWTFWAGFNWWFDNILFPAGIAKWGPLYGGIAMSVAAMLLNLACLVGYEYKKMSWIGDTEDVLEGMFKWTKKIMEHEYKYASVKFVLAAICVLPRLVLSIAVWCVAKGGIRAFLALSMFTDSFVTTAYLRKEKAGRSKAIDLGIFFASTVFSCAYWTFRSWGLVVIIEFIWNKIQIML